MAFNVNWLPTDVLLIGVMLMSFGATSYTLGSNIVKSRHIVCRNAAGIIVMVIYPGYVARPGHPRSGEWQWPLSTSRARAATIS
jgi:hypothetical protein